MTASVPPHVPNNKTNVGVLKALLIFGVIVMVLGTIAYNFIQARAEAAQMRADTAERARQTDEMVRHSAEIRAAAQRCRETGHC